MSAYVKGNRLIIDLSPSEIIISNRLKTNTSERDQCNIVLNPDNMSFVDGFSSNNKYIFDYEYLEIYKNMIARLIPLIKNNFKNKMADFEHDCDALKKRVMRPLSRINAQNRAFTFDRTINDEYNDSDQTAYRKILYEDITSLVIEKIENGVFKVYPIYRGYFDFDSVVTNKRNNGVQEGSKNMEINKEYNVIYYGVPGVGKSYKINEAKEQFNQERTVFHPEYTNSDFVGQLIPKRDENNEGNISYVFENGPFTRVLINALKNRNNDINNKYMLVVEEINRGNAAAIFGEIFQLLDRDESGKSKYAIENKTIVEAIRKEYPDYDKDYVETLKSYKPSFDKDKDYLVFIPENLYIWATMNTSDQNVYTLDTAFQRRWAMEMISINFNKDAASKEHGDLIIDGSNNLTWRDFVEKINSIMETKKVDMVSTDDKRLGTFFATEREICDRKLFIQKVIKYLWDDAFKLEKSEGEIFNIKKYPSLDKIVESDANIEDFFMSSLFGANSEIENENVDNEQES